MLPQTQLKFSRSHEGLKEVPKYLGMRGEDEDKMKVKSDLSIEIQFSSTEQLKKTERNLYPLPSKWVKYKRKCRA